MQLEFIEGFYKKEKAVGMAVECIIELLAHKTIFQEISLQLYFLKENCVRLMTVLTTLEIKKAPLACIVYNLLEDLRLYLITSCTKTTFGTETDRLLAKLSEPERMKQIKSFHKVFNLYMKKLEVHLDKHPAYAYYKAIRIFDPRQLLIMGHDITEFEIIPGLKNPSPELLEEWLISTQYQQSAIPQPLDLPTFWESVEDRFPLLSAVASEAIWMPVASVDVERSFSLYKHLLNDRRESLTEDNTKRLVMLYYNS